MTTHSLSIILRPRTALGHALVSLQEPAEMVALVAYDYNDANWLEKRYPWFNIIRTWERSFDLPHTTGPVRIYGSYPQMNIHRATATYCREMLDDIAIIRRILSVWKTLPVHVAYIVPITTKLHPSSLTLCSLTLESMLEKMCRGRADTLLSIFYPGVLWDDNDIVSISQHLGTSTKQLAHRLMKAAVSTKQHRSLVGMDAQLMMLAQHWHRLTFRTTPSSCVQREHQTTAIPTKSLTVNA